MTLIDVTVPVEVDGVPLFPGDPELTVERVQDMAAGAQANVSRLCCSVHTGTHVDAPVHFIEGAGGVDTIPLDALVGPAVVVDARGVTGHIDSATLQSLEVPAGASRVLFRTRNSQLWGRAGFSEDYVAITPEAAHELVDRGVRVVGVDYLSVAPYGDPVPTHVALLGAGVPIIEGLDLRAVEPRAYHLSCLPMRLVGADGAPARVVLGPA